ncbi:hypothetical protein RJ640_017973 [Escallonia rubra]|uniref:UspA domain-containing protein n=1 Tax=Escallonia rubra TaxID=112253 RepID=A0AA88R632_9ASTE|nr:hypothetical protein RJ640_017973 [Escallonia rubra]
MDRVMVAIEESDASGYALDWALHNLGESLAKAHLVIYTVQPHSDYDYVHGSSVAPPDLIRNLLETQKKVALALLDRAEAVGSAAGVVVETLTEVGEPKRTICDAVDRLNIQLLVFGSHGRGPLERTFLGSVSNYCVNNAKCPVLVVRKSSWNLHNSKLHHQSGEESEESLL